LNQAYRLALPFVVLTGDLRAASHFCSFSLSSGKLSHLPLFPLSFLVAPAGYRSPAKKSSPGGDTIGIGMESREELD
jgi:hypothetical protein